MYSMDIPGKLSTRALALTTTTALAGTLLVSGCSGGGTTAGTAGGATGRCPAVAGVSPHQVTYGLLYTATGPTGQSLGAYRAGIDARLGVANASGGVYGRTVSYTWADDGGQSRPNLAAAQQLVSSDKVFGIQEFSTTPIGSAAWLNREGVPVVGTSNDLVWTKYSNMFSYSNLVTSNTDSISTWGDYAKSQGARKAVVLVSNLSEGSRLIGAELATSLRAAGIEPVAIDAEPNTYDIQTVVRAIKNSGADLITGVVDPAEFIQIAIATRSALPTIKIESIVGYDRSLLAVGRQLAGMSVTSNYVPFELPIPAHQTFLNAMVQYSPQQQPAANEISLIGWVDADLMLRGLQAAGRCPTRQLFITNLRAVPNYNAGGLITPSVNLKATFGHLTACYAFIQVSSDGSRFVPVGDKPICGHRIS
ncbi:MAG: ABC transporter substrate-binding protein [Frankia sp.]